jgi:hypothetical protein
MRESKPSLRDTRKPRHGWFDYEIFDVFGDELRSDGIAVYMTLARFCYGGYRVKMSLREMAGHARMSKDTFARNLKRVIQLGLVIEHKGRTPQSASDYDLVDVKDLAAEYIRSGIQHKDDQKSVSGRDSQPARSVRGAQPTLADLIRANGNGHGDGSAKATQQPEDEVVELELSREEDSDCLTERQITGQTSFPPWGGVENRDVATEVSQNDPDFATEVSQAIRHPLSIKETRNKKQELKTSPLPLSQAKGGQLEHLAANAEDQNTKPNGKDQSPPRDALEAAVAKVMRDCHLSGRRIAKVIEASMRLDASRSDAPANWNAIAEAMSSSYEQFLRQQDLMAYKILALRFFSELWDDNRKWPWDEKLLREKAGARVGSRGP